MAPTWGLGAAKVMEHTVLESWTYVGVCVGKCFGAMWEVLGSVRFFRGKHNETIEKKTH